MVWFSEASEEVEECCVGNEVWASMQVLQQWLKLKLTSQRFSATLGNFSPTLAKDGIMQVLVDFREKAKIYLLELPLILGELFLPSLQP